MKKIVLISCAKTKLPCRAKAKDLYISPLFKLGYQYAQSINADAIYILSAKYGLIDCEKEIDTYDLTLNTMKTTETEVWARTVLRQLSQVCNLEEDYFVLLAGAKYRRFLAPSIRSYEVPLKGLKLGYPTAVIWSI